MKNFATSIAFGLSLLLSAITCAQEHPDVHLHVNPRWEECSFQLDPSLNQAAWQKFTREAALVTYFRPLTDARPMGKGNVELSMLQWKTAIDETSEAWNNTFVHPDTAHWLVGGPALAFPGLTFRTGLSQKIDMGIYWTQNPGANYGFYGAQLQYSFINDTVHDWALSARSSFVSLYGPKDVEFKNAGLDVLASKRFKIYCNWLSVSPYCSVSTFFSHAREKSDLVNLKDENLFGLQAAVGASAQISILRLGVEYNTASINTLSYKIGIGYNFGKRKV